jgi:hypothetical protein
MREYKIENDGTRFNDTYGGEWFKYSNFNGGWETMWGSKYYFYINEEGTKYTSSNYYYKVEFPSGNFYEGSQWIYTYYNAQEGRNFYYDFKSPSWTYYDYDNYWETVYLE